MNKIELSLDLAWALGLVAIGLAQWQRLGIAGQMAIAAARSLLQLLVMEFG
jgi:putative ABC transport system permease protein